MRVDWRKVCEDFVELGLTGDALADKLGIRLRLLEQIARGAKQPAPLVASKTLALWCHLTSKRVEFAPKTSEPIGQRGPPVEGLASNDEREPSFAQLQSIHMLWVRSRQGRAR